MDKDKLSELLLNYFINNDFIIDKLEYIDPVCKDDCDKLVEEIIKEFGNVKGE